MLSLKKSDIETISNILLELYAVSDIRQLEESFLADIRALIPYNQSSFQTIKACDDNVAIEDATFVDVDEHMLPLFNDIKTEKDYLKNFFHYSKPIVYLDSDILEGDIREKNEFYRKFLKPQGLKYSCGIILIKAKKVLGIITFFRSEEWGNFTEREIFILDIMKDHLSNMAEACMLKKADQMISENQNITPREKEIIDLIIKGYTNEEIAKELYISVSTTKKHVYNIFKKYNVKNRIAFIKALGLK